MPYNILLSKIDFPVSPCALEHSNEQPLQTGMGRCSTIISMFGVLRKYYLQTFLKNTTTQ
jgi:hypothetical protein